MPPKVIIFAGAPEAHLLKWDEDILLTTLQSPFLQLCGIEEGTPNSSEVSETSHPSWRLQYLRRPYLNAEDSDIGSESQLLDTTTEVNSQEYSSDSSEITSLFKTFTNKSFIRELSQRQITQESSFPLSTEKLLSQFYEESYSCHEGSIFHPSSPISTSTTSSSINMEEIDFENQTSALNLALIHEISPLCPLTDLKDVPTTAYLNSIYPQTLTLNVIVGLISISEFRVIKTRKGKNLKLIEILVGDETRSGFTINFWLPLPPCSKMEELTRVLYELQTRDIILVRNMALNGFRGKVYGQSLRKGITKVNLLSKSQMADSTLGGHFNSIKILTESKNRVAHAVKLKKVCEWSTKFVCTNSTMSDGSGENHKAEWEVLPPDTQ